MIDGDSLIDENHTFYFKSSLKNEDLCISSGSRFKDSGLNEIPRQVKSIVRTNCALQASKRQKNCRRFEPKSTDFLRKKVTGVYFKTIAD